MYVHSVKLINYKSFGDYPENEVILEPRVTAIIGKNESGKSNVLDGLSRIRFTGRNTAAFSSDIVNRNCLTGTENKYIAILKPTCDDISLGIVGDTVIELSKNSYVAYGGLLSCIHNTVQVDMDALIEILGTPGSNPLQLRDTDWTNYRMYYNELNQSEKLDIPLRTAAINFFLKHADRIAPEKRIPLQQIIERINTSWLNLIDTLPTFFYRKTDKHLATNYKFEDIDKELKNPSSYPNSLLSDLVKVIGITNDEFLTACRSGITPSQESLRRKINRLVNENINTKFKDFYQTEEIHLDLGFNNGSISFLIQSNNGSALMLSERSNGLRWYLDTFIDALANDISGRNIVYLLDEPGTSLHVNAQRELLELFSHLADRGNQVLYTTHSPYMLNTKSDGIHRIRAVVKNEDGFSYIYKTAYDSRIAPESQHDTLAPIISAIGMNLADTFGPAKDMVNIVTEGISDYIYLSSMAKLLNLDTSKFTIIPSVGASNCVNICTILHGWGCKYIALFDYDKAGVESGGEFLRTKMFFEMNKQYCYLKDVTQDEVNSKSYRSSKYLIEDVVTQAEIDRFCESTNTSKTLNKALIAKKMENAIENEGYVCGEECIGNFKSLFTRIISYVCS